MTNTRTQKGFTIVEIAVVITIVGLLAVLGMNAYGGIQNDANNSTVQADLQTMGAKMASYYARNGKYPTNATELSTSGVIKVTKKAYAPTGYSFLYCVVTSGNDRRYALMGRSASGTGYYVSSIESITQAADPWVAANATQCPKAKINTSDPSYTFVWVHENSAWLAWVNQ